MLVAIAPRGAESPRPRERGAGHPGVLHAEPCGARSWVRVPPGPPASAPSSPRRVSQDRSVGADAAGFSVGPPGRARDAAGSGATGGQAPPASPRPAPPCAAPEGEEAPAPAEAAPWRQVAEAQVEDGASSPQIGTWRARAGALRQVGARPALGEHAGTAQGPDRAGSLLPGRVPPLEGPGRRAPGLLLATRPTAEAQESPKQTHASPLGKGGHARQTGAAEAGRRCG